MTRCRNNARYCIGNPSLPCHHCINHTICYEKSIAIMTQLAAIAAGMVMGGMVRNVLKGMVEEAVP